MNNAIRYAGSVMLGLITFHTLMTGCSADSKPQAFVHEYTTVENEYDVETIKYECDDTDIDVIDVLSNDKYTVILRSFFDTKGENSHDFIKSVASVYDTELNAVGEFELTCDPVCYCLAGERLYLAHNDQEGISEYSVVSGDIQGIINVDSDEYEIASDGDNLYIVKPGCLVMVKSDGHNTMIKDDRIEPYERFVGLFESNNRPYIALGNPPDIEYFLIDTDSSKLELVADSEELDGLYEYTDRGYYFDYDGPAFVDFDSHKIRHIRLLDYIDVSPAESSGIFSYYAVANNNYVAAHSYANGNCSIQFIRDKGVPNSNVNKEKIVVGGFGMRSDICLAQAVYRFNTSNTDYRIVLDDYSMEYSYTTADEAQAQKLKLLAYFKENGYPDLLYGDFWDIDHMGRNGELIDLSDCLTEDIRSRMIPSVEELMTGGKSGKVYSAWAGFDIAGYWGEKDIFEGCSTIDQLDKIYESHPDGKKLFNAVLSMDLADSAIRYRITGMINKDPKARFTVDDIEHIIRFAVKHGITISDRGGYSMIDWDVINGDYMLQGGRFRYTTVDQIKKIEEGTGKTLCYIGFPSIYGSSEMILPHCLLAVPESSRHPQQCKQLISHIYDNDIQSGLTECGMFSVMDAEMSGLPDSVRNAISSVNYVNVTDWGIYSILFNEMESYYNDGKDIHSTAESMTSRINLYLDENY